jgi:hypothetical protein
MVSGVEFVDPPDHRTWRRGPSAKHVTIAKALRAVPGAWALVQTGVTRSMAVWISKGRGTAYRPAGSFEATARMNGDRYDIYARYVGENGEHR